MHAAIRQSQSVGDGRCGNRGGDRRADECGDRSPTDPPAKPPADKRSRAPSRSSPFARSGCSSWSPRSSLRRRRSEPRGAGTRRRAGVAFRRATTSRPQVSASSRPRRLTTAGQDRLFDSQVFSQWLNADQTGNAALAALYERRFRPEFRPAFDAWIADRSAQQRVGSAGSALHAAIRVRGRRPVRGPGETGCRHVQRRQRRERDRRRIRAEHGVPRVGPVPGRYRREVQLAGGSHRGARHVGDRSRRPASSTSSGCRSTEARSTILALRAALESGREGAPSSADEGLLFDFARWFAMPFKGHRVTLNPSTAMPPGREWNVMCHVTFLIAMRP